MGSVRGRGSSFKAASRYIVIKLIRKIHTLVQELRNGCTREWLTEKFVLSVLAELKVSLHKDKYWKIEDADNEAIFIPNMGEWNKILIRGKKDFQSIFVCKDSKIGFQVRGLFIIYPDTEDREEALQDISVIFIPGRGKYYKGCYITPYNELL